MSHSFGDILDMEDQIARASGDPIPERVVASYSSEFLAEYAAAAQALGYQPANLQAQAFRAFCSDRGIRTFDRRTVKAYLDRKYGGATRSRNLPSPNAFSYMDMLQASSFWVDKQGNRGLVSDAELRAQIDPMRREYIPTWGWRPLQRLTRPVGQALEWGRNDSDGLIGWDVRTNLTRLYDKPIPLPVLLVAKEIKDHFPEAQYFASDECTEHDMPAIRDPFLAVCIGEEFHIIEKWDEPGYREA